MQLESLVRAIPDYPKTGIIFRDVTTLFSHAEGFRATVERLSANFEPNSIDTVAGIEARGFVLGGAVAMELGKGFVAVRKKGKLPAAVHRESYELEYGIDEVEIHVDAVPKGARVLIVDDLIATGGTAMAAARLVERAGGKVHAAAFAIDLPELGGAKLLREKGIDVVSLLSFEGH
ncbi:MAG: adenine phosphoribosyltransferase [Devosia sp.]